MSHIPSLSHHQNRTRTPGGDTETFDVLPQPHDKFIIFCICPMAAPEPRIIFTGIVNVGK